MSDSTQKPRKREELKFRYSPYADTEDGVLVAYLKKGDGLSVGKEMILESARAFWLLAAYQSQGNLNQGELRRIGLSCCRALERQADYIRECLQVPHPGASPLVLNDSDDVKKEGNRSSIKAPERVTKTMW